MSRPVLADLPRLPWLSAAISRAGLLPTLRRKVVRHAVNATTLALMLLLLASAIRDFAEARAGLERETGLLADRLAASMLVRNRSGETEAVAALLAPVAEHAHIRGAAIYSREGDLLAAAGNPFEASSLLAPILGETLVVRSAEDKGQSLGEVRLAISPAFLVTLFLRELLLSLVALVLAVAIAALLLFRGLSRFSERLADMSTTMS